MKAGHNLTNEIREKAKKARHEKSLENFKKAHSLFKNGVPIEDIADWELGVSLQTVKNYLKYKNYDDYAKTKSSKKPAILHEDCTETTYESLDERPKESLDKLQNLLRKFEEENPLINKYEAFGRIVRSLMSLEKEDGVSMQVIINNISKDLRIS